LRDVKCPFCGTALDFRRLPVVATNVGGDVWRGAVGGSGSGRAGEDDDLEDLSRAGGMPGQRSDSWGQARVARSLPSGSPVLDWACGLRASRRPTPERAGGWPVIRRPAAETAVRGWRKVLPPTVDDGELGPPEDLPAYLCLKCLHPLPSSLRTHEVYTVAVVGTKGAGKSTFLATMAHEAGRRQGLRFLGVTEFAPDEITGTTYHNKYYQRLFRQKMTLPPTDLDLDIRFQPLTFHVTAERDPDLSLQADGVTVKMTLMLHDVSGEVLTKHTDRVVSAPFVRRADAIIFLVDPLAFEPVREWRERGGLAEDPDVRDDYYQVDLLRACLREVGEERLRDIPVAITLCKSDVVSAMLKRDFVFSRPASRKPVEWFAERNAIDGEVIGVLEELDAADIVAAGRTVPNSTFHAVAPIGTQPDHENIPEMRPLRCLDPVAQILLTLIHG
jgi:energy-coupling factor transporter ATP-binding protein EcfA2